MEIAPVEKELQETALTLKGQALSIKVINTESYEAAGNLGKALKELEEKIITYHKPIKQAIDASKKAALDREKADLAPVQEAISILRTARNNYAEEQERKRRAEEERLRKIEEDRAAKEKEKLLKKAEKAEAKGDTEKAEELQEAAENVYVAPVTVESTVNKAAKDTEVTITDMKAFIKGLVDQNMQPTMLEAKTAPLKTWVKVNALKSFPGLAIREVTKARF